MDKVTKHIKILDDIKWLGLALGAVMCVVVQSSFGNVGGVVLGTIAGLSFIRICENAKKNILSDHVADDIHAALEAKGFKECVIEIKLLKVGMLIRIYTINFGEKVANCNAALVNKIERSWYREKVWITQLIDVENEDEIEDARFNLDNELIDDMRNMRNNMRRRK